MDEPSPSAAPDLPTPRGRLNGQAPDPEVPADPETPAEPPPSGDVDAQRSPLRMVVAIAVALTGMVWLLQGLGVLTVGNSFMIGDPTWVVIGAVFVGAGVFLGIRARRGAG